LFTRQKNRKQNSLYEDTSNFPNWNGLFFRFILTKHAMVAMTKMNSTHPRAIATIQPETTNDNAFIGY
jgi:hypothetical protein